MGSVGLEQTSSGLRAYFDDSVSPSGLGFLTEQWQANVQMDLPSVVYQEANDRDPILIGKRFVLVPGERIILPIDAGMAFGSGRHESTQLCLMALEELILGGETVYDVGCGSGILALAASRLGAGKVVGLDIDEASIQVAQQHFPGPLFVGSADGLKSHSADVVLSNITGRVNDAISSDLQRIARPDGVIVLAGFQKEGAPTCVSAYRITRQAGWECWLCHPSEIHPANNDASLDHDSCWWL